MAKGSGVDEVAIVRFFEEGPIEKVEVVFRIVTEKVRERLRAKGQGNGDAPRREAAKRRGSNPAAETPAPGVEP